MHEVVLAVWSGVRVPIIGSNWCSWSHCKGGRIGHISTWAISTSVLHFCIGWLLCYGRLELTQSHCEGNTLCYHMFDVWFVEVFLLIKMFRLHVSFTKILFWVVGFYCISVSSLRHIFDYCFEYIRSEFDGLSTALSGLRCRLNAVSSYINPGLTSFGVVLCVWEVSCIKVLLLALRPGGRVKAGTVWFHSSVFRTVLARRSTVTYAYSQSKIGFFISLFLLLYVAIVYSGSASRTYYDKSPIQVSLIIYALVMRGDYCFCLLRGFVRTFTRDLGKKLAYVFQWCRWFLIRSSPSLVVQ